MALPSPIGVLSLITLWQRIGEEVVAVNDAKPGHLKCETCGAEKEKGDRNHVHCTGCGVLKGKQHTLECPKIGLVAGRDYCKVHRCLLAAGAACRKCAEVAA